MYNLFTFDEFSPFKTMHWSLASVENTFSIKLQAAENWSCNIGCNFCNQKMLWLAPLCDNTLA